eukprot:1465472-Pyramimonas_sp.AAC.1
MLMCESASAPNPACRVSRNTSIPLSPFLGGPIVGSDSKASLLGQLRVNAANLSASKAGFGAYVRRGARDATRASPRGSSKTRNMSQRDYTWTKCRALRNEAEDRGAYEMTPRHAKNAFICHDIQMHLQRVRSSKA